MACALFDVMRSVCSPLVAMVLAACDPEFSAPGRDQMGLSAPIVSRPLPTETPFAAANLFDATNPAVGIGKGQSLVAWIGQRHPNPPHVLAVRVAADGTVLDRSPISVGPSRGHAADVDVAFDGTNYLVVWSQSVLLDYYEIGVLAARVSPDGTVLDPRSIQLSSLSGRDLLRPRATFNGTNFVVAWTSSDVASGHVEAMRVSPGGVVLDATPIALSQTADPGGQVDIAAAGSTAVVTWADTRLSAAGDIRAARVDASGTLLDPSGIVVCSSAGAQLNPSIECGSAQCLISWTDATTTPARPFAARLSSAGAVLDANGVAVSSATSGSTTVSFDGTNYFVSFSEPREGFETIVFKRLSPSGALMDPAPRVVHSAVADQHTQTSASNSAESLFAWADERAPGGPTIHAKRIASSGDALGARLAVSNPDEPLVGEDPQLDPVAAFDGKQIFVVWDGWGRIVGSRLSLSGALLDPTGILINSGDSELPTVAWGGAHFEVTWHETRSGQTNTFGARVSTEGGLLALSGEALVAGAGLENRSLAGGTGEFLSLTEQYRTGGFGLDVRGVRIGSDGRARDATPLPIATTLNNQVTPALTFDGARYLVFWSDLDDAGIRAISGRAVTASTGALSPVVAIGHAHQPSYTPTAAFGAGQTLVVWDRDDGLHASFLMADGGVTQPWALAPSTDAQRKPRVAFDGTSFLVAWEQRDDLYGAQVFADGTTSAPFPLVASPSFELAATLVAVGPGRYYMAYNTFDFSGTNRSPKVRGVFITFTPRLVGEQCVDTNECASATCANGVCTSPRELTVGCGCGALNGAPVLLGLLALCMRRRRTASLGALFTLTGCFLYPNVDELTCHATVETDAHHCGRCGHDCLGGQCSQGHCEAFVVAQAQARPSAIDVDAQRIWWANFGNPPDYDDGSVVSARKDDNTYAVLDGRALQAGKTAVWLRTSGNYVYWANAGYTRRVWRADAASGLVQIVTPTEVLPLQQFVIDPIAGEIIWTEGDKQPDGGYAGRLRAIPTGGGDPRDLLRVNAELAAIALDDGGLYVSVAHRASAPNVIQRVPKAGCPDAGVCGVQVASLTSEVAHLLVADGETVYWVDRDLGHVGSTSGGVSQPVAIGAPPLRGLAVDATWVYWTEESAGRVMRRRKDLSAGPEVLADGQRRPGAMVVDEAAIYWVNQGTPSGADGQILRLVRPD